MGYDKKLSHFQWLSFLGLMVALGLVGIAYCLEYYFRLNPCPLCHLQRYILFVIAFFFLLGAIYDWGHLGKIVFSASNGFFSVLGILLALRHVWLQYMTVDDGTLSCTAGLERLLQFQPLMDVLKEVLINANGCNKIDFTILKLPLSVWSLFGFMVFFVYSCFMFGFITKRRI